jgi:hypothetical protein
MSANDRYDALMLDHLYGLLEPAQAAELEAFLATPEGAPLRARAEEWQRQLSLAAKAQFPGVQFAPPHVAPAKPHAAPKATPAKPQPVPKKVKFAWARWAVAASVLLVVGGFGVPAALHYHQHEKQVGEVAALRGQFDEAEKARDRYVATANAKVEQAARDKEHAAEENAELLKQYDQALVAARKAIEEKQFIVRLSGPERAQPGAPNEWKVEMFKRSGAQALPSRVEWQVRDKDGTVVYSEAKSPPARGHFHEPPTVSLPVAFWEKVKPDSDLVLEVTAHDEGLKADVSARVRLGRPVYVTHLATDKPLYKPGETVLFRSLTLDRATFLPPEKDTELEFRITRPGGQPEPILVDGVPLRGTAKGYADPNNPTRHLLGPDKKPLRGIGCGEFALDRNAPGGEYVLSVVDVTPSFDEVRKQVVHKDVVLETRKFNVIEYKPELFDKTLEFDGKSYGPGDVVQVKCTASRTQGGKLKRAVVAATAEIDGRNVIVSNPGKTDDEGAVRLKFTVPATVTNGNGTLTVTFIDGGDAEPIIRPIPVVGRVIHVEFFPEGGDLIENVPARVYFRASTPTGKPADLKGYLTDGTEIVTDVATFTDADEPGVNRGQGAFTFTPKPGKTYFLKVQKPSGLIEPPVKLAASPRTIAAGVGLANLAVAGTLGTGATATGFELPKAKADGVVLTALDPVTRPGQPLRVRLQNGGTKRTLLVGAYARGRLADHQRVEVEAGKAVDIALNPGATAGGVTRLTVFEEKAAGEGKKAELVPVAERLVYRRPAKQLVLNVNSDKNRYNPGSKVGLDLNAVTEDEKPAAAVLYVAVVNQSVLTMADEKTGRLMPTHFLLAGEVSKPEELEHADFLLYDPEQDRAPLAAGADDRRPARAAKAEKALDLLLGTQGWRRFAEQHPPAPGRKPAEDVERLLVANGQKAQAPVETFRQEEERVIGEYTPKLETSLARLTEAEEKNAEVEQGFTAARHEAERLEAERGKARKRYEAAVAELRRLEGDDGTPARAFLFSGLCLGLLVISGGCLALAASRGRREGAPYMATGVVTLALCAVAVLAAMKAGPGDEQGKQVAAHPARLKAPEGMPDVLIDEPHAVVAATGAANMPREQEMMMAEGRARDGAKFAADAAPAAPPPAPGGFGGLGGGGPFPPHAMPPAFAPGAANANGGFAGGFNGGGGFGGRGLGMPGVNKFDERINRDAMKMKGEKGAMHLADGKGGKRDLEEQKRFGAPRLRVADRYNQMNRARLEQLGKIQARKTVATATAPARPGFGLGGPAGAPAFPQPAADMEIVAQQLAQINQEPGFFVREYKFTKDPNAKVRDDFTETVYWHPVLVLPESGRIDVNFQLSDSVARYQVLVAGHTLDGRIGATTTHIEARKPFTVDPKTPIEITAGDRIDVPVRVVNDSDVRRAVTFSVAADGLKPADAAARLTDGKLQDWLDLAANAKGRKVFSFRPTKTEGNVGFTVVGTSDPVEAADTITRTFRVVPEGFPAAGAASDLLEQKAIATIELPKDVVKGSLKVRLNVYPTTLADLQAGLDGLLREPCGCFEQTSTSNYPNLLILDYLKSSDQAKPELAQRAKDLLDRGYSKLVSFECPKSDTNDKRGFEWFGQADQQHQALTAYGLLQFKDLAKVHKVDPELIKRTQQYLLAQRDGQGGFKRNARAIDSFGRAPDHITNAYIVWALVESDPDDKEGMDLSKELAALKKQATDHADGKDDPYFLALVANALLHRPAAGGREAAVAVLGRIAEKHLKEGCVEGAKTSITMSGGRDLQIETTALAVLGWLRCGEPTKFVLPVKAATKWLGQQRGGYGGFGSTQSTILALKALIEHTKAARKPAEAGEFTLVVNGKKFSKSFTAKDAEVITLEIENAEEVLKPGRNEAEVSITTKQAYPFSLAWSCNTLTPLSSAKCAVEVATKLDRQAAAEGETVRLNVSLTNKLKEGHGMTVAVVGLPGGCRLPADLKELTKLREDGTISYFEVRGRELVLYWRSLKPEQAIDLSVGLICEVPGAYRGPASRGYLYYNADHKHWVEPLALTITPSGQPQEPAEAGAGGR